MPNKYWTKKRKELFPEIKDWTSDHNEYRLVYDVNKLTWNQWFYFHPSAFKLIYYGNNVMGLIIFGLATAYLYIKGSALFFVPLFFTLFLGYGLVNKIRNRKTIGDMTFYDLYMREI